MTEKTEKQYYQNIDFGSDSARKKIYYNGCRPVSVQNWSYSVRFQCPLTIRIKMQQPILRLIVIFTYHQNLFR